MRPGRDDKAARPNLQLTGPERAGTREPCLAAQHPDPEPLEPLDGIVWRNRRDDVLDAVGGGGEIDIGTRGGDAESRAAPRQVGETRGGEQRLRRDAAEVQAITAHQPALDEHDVGAHLSRTGGGRQSR